MVGNQVYKVIPCNVISITTPKKIQLDGLLFGSESPKKIIIFVHGLGSSCFSNLELITPLVDQETSVITFNNRGHDQMSDFKKIDKRKKKGYYRIPGGEVHEKFTESSDDIQGAICFVKQMGNVDIFLMGHSTGSQKCVYFLKSSYSQNLVKGLILLSPMSDYAAITKLSDPIKLKKALNYSQDLIKEGKPNQLIPTEVWPYLHDAQRFVSLYSADSPEEIFSYSQKGKTSVILHRIKIPTLVILAQKDEYRDRPINKIKDWFEENIKTDKQIALVPKASHGFRGQQKEVVRLIKEWLIKIR